VAAEAPQIIPNDKGSTTPVAAKAPLESRTIAVTTRLVAALEAEPPPKLRTPAASAAAETPQEPVRSSDGGAERSAITSGEPQLSHVPRSKLQSRLEAADIAARRGVATELYGDGAVLTGLDVDGSQRTLATRDDDGHGGTFADNERIIENTVLKYAKINI